MAFIGDMSPWRVADTGESTLPTYFSGEIITEFLDPISTTGLSEENVDELTKKTFSIMQLKFSEMLSGEGTYWFKLEQVMWKGNGYV